MKIAVFWDMMLYSVVGRLFKVRVKVILQPAVSRSVCPGVRAQLALVTDFSFSFKFSLEFRVCYFYGALSDERTGLYFTVAAWPHQHSPSQV
jgi:hypothetical protein